jgi:hypothetical protein
VSHFLKNHELTFALIIRNYDLSLSYAKFLQSSGIVPNNWMLNRQPVANEQVSQTVYSNGVNVIGEPNRCLFGEILDDKTLEDCLSPEIVQSYVSKLSNLDYYAFGINFQAYLPLDSLGLESYQDFYNQILVSGSWQKHGNKPVQTELKLVYELEHCNFSLTVNEGKLRQPDSEALPIILFSGNFAYELDRELETERADKIKEIVGNWQNEMHTFQKIVSDFPLETEEKLLVALEA